MSETNGHIHLSGGEDWALADINGSVFEVEILRAYREIGAIHRKHKDTANECLDCGTLMPGINPLDKDDEGNLKPLTCSCGSTNIDASQSLLDAVADLLRTRYGVARVSNMAASKFYNFVIERVTAEKKTPLTPAESATGTELTPAAGAS